MAWKDRTRQSWVLRQRVDPTDGQNEREGEPLQTEQTYIPTKQLIERFKTAGVIYQEWKKGTYDFEHGKEDLDTPVPERAPGFDLADAMEIQAQARRNIDAAAATQEALKNVAEDGRGEVLEDEVISKDHPKTDEETT